MWSYAQAFQFALAWAVFTYAIKQRSAIENEVVEARKSYYEYSFIALAVCTAYQVIVWSTNFLVVGYDACGQPNPTAMAIMYKLYTITNVIAKTAIISLAATLLVLQGATDAHAFACAATTIAIMICVLWAETYTNTQRFAQAQGWEYCKWASRVYYDSEFDKQYQSITVAEELELLGKSSDVMGLTLHDLFDGPAKPCTDDTRRRYEEGGKDAIRQIEAMLAKLPDQ
jgi:hypothetical protein